MKMVDLRCRGCQHVLIDVLLRDDGAPAPTCPQCQSADLERAHLSINVIGDDIPGGMWIKHGICNPDGSPKRYDTKSSMRDTAKAMRLVNRVEHSTANGHDRQKHTQRFI